ncbi:Glycosyltransferase involved in cell wall biogeneis [Candidatus Paraburkholderia calva]|nr:Glycosyltransferase involved in cell wall biogeneis [Candidatus Paraburkholderia calva]
MLGKQTHLPDTVIVVARSDDHATLDALRKLQTPFALDVQRVSAPGTVAARNLGLDANRDDVVAILDDDTEPFPDWLERAMRHFADDPSLGGLGGRDRCFDGQSFDDRQHDVVGKVQWFGRLIGNHHFGHGAPREADFLKGANMIFRTEAIERIRFDPRLHGSGAPPAEDVSFSIWVKADGWKLMYDPAVLVNHYPGVRTEQRLYVSVHRVFDHKSFRDFAFNEAIAVWPALTQMQRAAFIAWSVLMGTGTCPGLAQALRHSRSLGASSWKRFAVAQSGKAKAFALLLRGR